MKKGLKERRRGRKETERSSTPYLHTHAYVIAVATLMVPKTIRRLNSAFFFLEAEVHRGVKLKGDERRCERKRKE